MLYKKKISSGWLEKLLGAKNFAKIYFCSNIRNVEKIVKTQP